MGRQSRQKHVPARTPSDVPFAPVHITIFVSALSAVLVILALAVLTWASVPLVDTIAGKDTNFTFNVSVAVNITLAASLVISSGAAAVMTSRARTHKKEARRLEAELGRRNKELEEATKELEAVRRSRREELQ